MTVIAPPPEIKANVKLAEQRVIFYDLNWESYQQILQALGNHRASRLTYEQGTLEITMPSEEHEWTTRLFDLFIRILVAESGLKLKTMGSTTLLRPELLKGAEPDNGFYIQNSLKVQQKIVDLQTDPPPDLVVEIDITHTDINKFNLYAGLGVPEFWRYNGQALQFYCLQDGIYQEVETSPTFSFPLKERFYQFLQDCFVDEIEGEKQLRAWVREILSKEASSR
ncbi:MAG: Uma2 family endonuclease [Merismopediaceae bacterium]|nr:Uma2 family endonuclease [Merismopediaceae bacterium]